MEVINLLNLEKAQHLKTVIENLEKSLKEWRSAVRFNDSGADAKDKIGNNIKVNLNRVPAPVFELAKLATVDNLEKLIKDTTAEFNALFAAQAETTQTC